jgi:hypothetical protein
MYRETWLTRGTSDFKRCSITLSMPCMSPAIRARAAAVLEELADKSGIPAIKFGQIIETPCASSVFQGAKTRLMAIFGTPC